MIYKPYKSCKVNLNKTESETENEITNENITPTLKISDFIEENKIYLINRPSKNNKYSCTREILITYCRSNGIFIKSSMKKEEMINYLINYVKNKS